MKLQIYTVFDSAVGAYLQPFFSRSNGEAIRSFQDAVNDPKTAFSQHVNDYTLYWLGEWDDGTGVVVPNEPTRVASANDVLIRA